MQPKVFYTCCPHFFVPRLQLIYSFKIIVGNGSILSEKELYDDSLPSTKHTIEPQFEDYSDNSRKSKLKQYNLLLQNIEMERRLGNNILQKWQFSQILDINECKWHMYLLFPAIFRIERTWNFFAAPKHQLFALRSSKCYIDQIREYDSRIPRWVWGWIIQSKSINTKQKKLPKNYKFEWTIYVFVIHKLQ